MKDIQTRLQVSVLGPFKVQTDCGRDLTPKGAKHQALLALLVMSPDMSRPRRWIEDKLWSTFGAEQASANLRQALSKLRVILGEYGAVLQADRSTVSLDTDMLTVDLIEDVLAIDARVELLEGIDARDPEFEDWLRMERRELAELIARATPSDARGILVNCTSEAEDGSLREQMLGDVLAHQVGENIAEHVRAWRQSSDGGQSAELADSDVRVSTQVMSDPNGYTVFLKAVHQPSGRLLYSKLLPVRSLNEVLETHEPIGKVIFEAADQVVGKLPQVLDNARPEARATALSRLGLYRMFSFETHGLREAAGLMKQAYDHDENGLYLAWASLIRLTQMMEMSEGDGLALLDEAIDLQHRAVQQASDNPLVQAIVSKVRSTGLGETAGVLEHAKLAVERNPAGAFSWKSLADAYLVAGQQEEAFEASRRACNLATGSPFKHWWDTGHCVIAIACDRPHEAMEAGEAATRAAPLSRPALRHLLALYAQLEMPEKAQETARKLMKIETDFSIDRMVRDDSYPVRTLRNKGMLEPIRSLFLS